MRLLPRCADCRRIFFRHYSGAGPIGFNRFTADWIVCTPCLDSRAQEMRRHHAQPGHTRNWACAVYCHRWQDGPPPC
jgi:hypothetical protein